MNGETAWHNEAIGKMMTASTSPSLKVEAEVVTAIAKTRMVWFELAEPPDHQVRWDRYYLDLSVTPRPVNMRACYPDRWGTQHFRPIGDMFLVPPGELFHVKADSPVHQTSIICELDPDLLHQWLGFEIDWNDRRLAACLDISSSSIRHLLRKLAEEARNPGISSGMYVNFVAGQLALEIGRQMDAIDEAPVTGGLAPWRLRIIDDRLKAKGETPTLNELAELCSLSVRQLTRGFRTSRGVTVGDYVTQAKIEHAKRLLNAGESMKSIAHELGYTSTSSFSYAFRKLIGLTPRQFLNRVYRSK